MTRKPGHVHIGHGVWEASPPEKNDPATEQMHSLIALARVAERDANRERKAGNLDAAADQYERARQLYDESNGAWARGDYGLQHDIKRSIERCREKRGNCINPKPKRAPAGSPRPACLACSKPLPRSRAYVEAHRTGVDGLPGAWGAYGDNALCGISCGYRYALAIAQLLHKQGKLR